MRLLRIEVTLLLLTLLFGGCEEFLSPVNDNHNGINRLYEDPGIAEGLLMKGYAQIPSQGLQSSDYATDDAVTNVTSDYFARMATGEWSSQFNPMTQWSSSLTAVFYINKFLTIVDTVPWKWTNPSTNQLFIRRLKGEAYAIRGLAQYTGLVSVAGYSGSGELLGIPLYDKFVEVGGNFNIPRATFNESIERIYSDFDKALEYLTMDDFYKNIDSTDQLPPGYEDVTVGDYNLVFGDVNNQRISGRIVRAMKARVALLAASPAFSNGDITLWDNAANFAGTAIQRLEGIAGLDPDGHKFFQPALIDNILLPARDQKEVVWRYAIGTNNYVETENFPPSLFGLGRMNPTQNLVDAFPMANGYPISHALSHFNPANPYFGRDPRLSLYIVYNKSSLKGQTIITAVGGGRNAKDSLSTSTRTGYYLKKHLREDVNLDPVSSTTKKHYDVRMRYTELFLIYAEAANEAWGPDGTGSYGFSARDVIAAIRNRAGLAQPDNYLSSISSTEEMRQLIRNERRLELCFEGFRFWDLRRWKADLTKPAIGINIDKNAVNFTPVQVESRVYDNSYMHYGPVPYNEVLRFDKIEQNNGW